ncbi:MAG: bifunctional diaminohydroxyphosphoribosylaminopyrimidine deaminase/5-amino-6-(5-phosphoribosylamino)uracil reductase RibD [Gammaproteobacteria bacterium]|nr:bifunctional diaminohydroxyphosphoribosylaminopyrimidine deaminase/5-amino-6-(5-phosphoribosylamino)uracil reductase RibD [Gammaproteobacteria bacterium]MBU1645879.1 bifunctional diaminohydroxyphosphoribosylaminopyrimidine deaminase/5-amino-6-(5-phosphoribosylamino)uracil reductase RibD [Gammaproteobacteria bacterium]MBU1971941.1 bifunctional diaminohydroxyphosphoribosylaminopyrimidine deaminase/5-amino-6-(5-phosphoribosylamino)uracil reductase RibD [Gammaproteobacteria bacterium]
MSFSAADREFMARALALAERGLYTTTPNPRVGCVLVRDGAVIGEGWHEMAGRPHAEVNALEKVGAGGTAQGAQGVARGATAYVTLEPCCHHGRTPPCADALIDAGISRVVAAMRDPNPLVAGAGLTRLMLAGIQVESGLMENEARELNIGFVSRMTRGRPWLRLKVAASLDGKTALNNGKSQWITGPEARRDAHGWRARSCAMLTGIGTVRDDNPRLTVRDIDTPRQPLRVVVDSRLEISPDAAILDGGNCLVACAVENLEKAALLRALGADVVVLPNAQGKVDLPALLSELARRGINEVMAEAGFRLNGSLLREGCVDELLIYQAPLLLGDAARGMFDLPELVELGGARRLEVVERRAAGADFFLRARLA